MDLYHYLFKFIVVGDASVGKSCILLSYTEKQFRDEHDTTIGVEFGSQIYKHNNKTIKIQIWDTAGQEAFRSITRSYYKGSIGVILVFDVTNKESYYNVLKWYNEVCEQASEQACIYLVGNKIDLDSQYHYQICRRQVSTLEAKSFADQYKMHYMETSAKSGQNVDLLFESCSQEILVKIDQNQIDFTNENSGIKLGTYFKQEQVVVNLQQPQQQQDKKGCC